MFFDSRDDGKGLDEILTEIVQITRQVMHEWHDGACAPADAARLLKESRLDWLLSLSYPLKLWASASPTKEDNDGLLILAWANLGSLVEGWLKFFLCVFLHDYRHSVRSKRAESIFKKLWEERKSEAKDADLLKFDDLREFYRAEVWEGLPDVDKWDQWLRHVQERRNTIHAFKNRDLGNFDELRGDLCIYRKFLDEIRFSLPDCPDRDWEP
jgi:hypothetical protein